jgi:hypothetical protein
MMMMVDEKTRSFDETYGFDSTVKKFEVVNLLKYQSEKHLRPLINI